MNATDILSNEHRAIKIVLDAMEKVAARLETDQEVDLSIAESSLEFATGFVDRCHHAKEEELLFPRLEELGVTREGGPISVMLHEHDEGRNFIKAIRDNLGKVSAGDKSARLDLAEAFKRYADLLRSHISKEDEVLFVVASGVLSEEDNKQLIKGFDEIEDKKIGPGVHEEYHKMLDNLAERIKSL